MPAFSLTFSDVAGLAGLLTFSLVLLWCWCVLMTAWILTHPPRRTYGNAFARGRPGDPGEVPPLLMLEEGRPPAARSWREWNLSLDNVTLRLPVWDVVGGSPAGPTVVMLHGWGDSRIGALARLQAAEASACRVLILESRGHGEAPGTTTLGTHEVNDVLTLLDAAEVRGAVQVWGWSMGAGVALAVAGAAPVSGAYSIVGVFAESVYRRAATPAANVMLRSGVPTRGGVLWCALTIVQTLGADGLMSPSFDRAHHAGLARQRNIKITCIHGTHDDISPIGDARELCVYVDALDAAASITTPVQGTTSVDRGAGGDLRGRSSVTLREIEGAGHHGIWTDPEFAPIALQAWRDHVSARVHTAPAAMEM